MAFSTINFETLRSLTEESTDINRSLTEGSEDNRNRRESSKEISLAEDAEGSEEKRSDVSNTKHIEYKVRQLLPIPDELWRRSAVSRFIFIDRVALRLC